jgi:hypothetical protein
MKSLPSPRSYQPLYEPGPRDRVLDHQAYAKINAARGDTAVINDSDIGVPSKDHLDGNILMVYPLSIMSYISRCNP